jgi:hypothetical protein
MGSATARLKRHVVRPRDDDRRVQFAAIDEDRGDEYKTPAR